MYLSHKYKLIFLRAPRAAGSSIVEFLVKNLDDPEAIHTTVEDGDTIQGNVPPVMLLNKRHQRCHLSIEDLIEYSLISKKQAKEYYVFTVLRDPVERQRSFYRFLKQWWSPDTEPSTEEYIDWNPDGYSFRKESRTAIKTMDLIKLNDSIVGKVWLYEYIEGHLKDLMTFLNTKVVHPMPHYKKTNKPDLDISFSIEMLSIIKKDFLEDFNTYSQLRVQSYETDPRYYP